jgi:protein MpaA
MSPPNPDPTEPVYPHKLRRLYWPFLALAEVCREIVGTVAGSFEWDEKRYTIPRFVFHGPSTGLPPIRLGLFALLQGDDQAGALGLQRFLNALVDNPAPAAGYELALYPLCNPTGYEDGTRHNRAGYNLTREFWRGSAQPEIKIMEAELRAGCFDGIIALRTDGSSAGLQGYTPDPLLNEHLLRPSLSASAQVLPAGQGTSRGLLPAGDSQIGSEMPGALAAPPDQRTRPFEIVFETPRSAPMTQQIEAISCALQTVLKEYRAFIAQGIHL